jgi:hypothetical protein
LFSVAASPPLVVAASFDPPALSVRLVAAFDSSVAAFRLHNFLLAAQNRLLLSISAPDRAERYRRRNQAMADAAAQQNLANALTALTAVLAGMGPAAGAGGAAVPGHAAMTTDPFLSADAFDLSTRAGSNAYITASAPLDVIWDGTIEKFPSFLIALRIRASETNWGAAAPQGILVYAISGADQHLFDNYDVFTDAILEAARVARTNDRAIQNARTLYKCLKTSIGGDLKATLFDQQGNLLTHEDGPTLFKRLTSFTMAASLQLSMLSFQQILEFNPAEHNYNVSTMNTKLNHLFVLATTRQRVLSQPERIQHTLTAYARIKQPELWAQWVRTQTDNFDDGLITDCQSFMNSATIKYIKIASAGSFEGSSTTVQEDIVAMVASAAAKRKKGSHGDDSSKGTKDQAPIVEKKHPPFVKHFKLSSAPDSVSYKVGDSKEWNGATWYFCDCPSHKDKIKWHTHPHTTCRTRKRWLEEGGSNSNSNSSPPVAHVAGATDTSSSGTSITTTTTDSSSTTDVTSLLAAALSLAGNNSAAKEAIADALNAIHDV